MYQKALVVIRLAGMFPRIKGTCLTGRSGRGAELHARTGWYCKPSPELITARTNSFLLLIGPDRTSTRNMQWPLSSTAASFAETWERSHPAGRTMIPPGGICLMRATMVSRKVQNCSWATTRGPARTQNYDGRGLSLPSPHTPLLRGVVKPPPTVPKCRPECFPILTHTHTHTHSTRSKSTDEPR